MSANLKKWEIMKLCEEGAPIQIKHRYIDRGWTDMGAKIPSWDWTTFDYRVKPESEKVSLDYNDYNGEPIRKINSELVYYPKAKNTQGVYIDVWSTYAKLAEECEYFKEGSWRGMYKDGPRH
jgi:hypothetical protein